MKEVEMKEMMEDEGNISISLNTMFDEYKTVVGSYDDVIL